MWCDWKNTQITPCFDSARTVVVVEWWDGVVVWCGVVWCGVVWCGVVMWYGVVRCGDVVWCGVVWCGVLWKFGEWFGEK